MTFEFRLNMEELKEGYKAIRIVAMERTNLKILTYFVVSCIVVVTLGSLIVKGTVNPMAITAFLFPLILLTVIKFSIIYSPFTDSLLKQQLKNSPEIKGEITILVNDEELTITTLLSTSTMRWSMYTHWQETLNLFLVYRQSDIQFIMFPKKAFADDTQIDEFQQLLRNNLSEK
jgi:YcxB-like protein